MRIALVDNLLLEWKSGKYIFDLQPHLGLISLIALAEKANHEVVLVDPKLAVARGDLPLDENLYKALASHLAELRCDVVGFTTLGCNFICTLKIAEHFKRASPSVPLLLGGPHATILYDEILSQFSQFDVIALGEAEESFLPLLAALGTGELQKVPGLAYRSRGSVTSTALAPIIEDLDKLPFPAYEHYPIADVKPAFLRVEAGRGCPFRCTFCSTASFFGRKYRLKSAARIVAELDSLNNRYGVARFALTHDLFTVNKKKVAEFCDLVSDRGYTWTCSARMDCVDQPLIAKMADAGCRSIYYGVETGSARMQKLIDKNLDLALFEPTLDATAKSGMEATVSFITGYPQELAPDQDQTLDLIGRSLSQWPKGLTIQLHLLTPEPGTKLLDSFKQELEYDGHISDFNFPTLEPTDADIMSGHPSIFMNHHYYRSMLPRERHVFVTCLHSILYQLGFYLLSYILECYRGSYSALLADLAEYRGTMNRRPPVDRDFVQAYFEKRWGTRHHLTSLVRYMFCAIELRDFGPDLQHQTSDSADAYLLNPQARVLRDIHDCAALLLQVTRPAQSRHFQNDILVNQGSYALCLAGQDKLRNFSLTDPVGELLEFARLPRSRRELLGRIRDLHGDSFEGYVLDDLIAAQLLVAPINGGSANGERIKDATALGAC